MPIDPFSIEVIKHKLTGVVEEMQTTLLKSSFSPFVKEALDASASLFTLDGETLAQATAIPLHLATMIPMVNKILERFPLSTMRERDIFIFNDPYLGGTHLPDIIFVEPVFVEGRPLALAACITHHQDIGGLTPGSLPTNATEIFQEGLRLPPLQLRRGGELDGTILEILNLNSRTPDLLTGDLNAQIAACSVGVRRLKELALEWGAGLLGEVFRELLDRSELLTRKMIRELPDGVYRYEDYLDNDGVALDEPVLVSVEVTIADDQMIVDLSRSSPQVRGPFNSVPSGAFAAGCFVVRALGDDSIPTNGGCFRPLKIKVKPGTIFDPREPAPVNARTATVRRAAGCVMAALRKALPERFPADGAHSTITLAIGGRRRDGSRFVSGQAIGSGSGARADRDGVDTVSDDLANSMNLPIEAMELDLPVRVRCRKLRSDSGGAGRHRGGLGLHTEIEALADDLVVTYRGERHRHPARGFGGGAPGANGSASILRRGGAVEELASKAVCRLGEGDVLVLDTPGGGGHGSPSDREADDVRNDLSDGKIGRAAAEEIYRLSRRAEPLSGRRGAPG